MIVEVVITGNPEPKVTWMRGITALKETSDNEFSFDQATKTYRLIVYTAEKKDAGKYKCKAENSVGKETKAFEVKVEEASKELQVNTKLKRSVDVLQIS